jgi:23S rRNA pseudouridine1911/1915/1917 synthase
MTIKILHEDDSIVVAIKPAKLPVQSDKTLDDDLLSIVQRQIKCAELFLVHRLDRPVSGLVVMAKSHRAAKKLITTVSKSNNNKKILGCSNWPSHRR